MISFKDYLNQESKKYVCLHFDDKTNESLREYAKSNGFNLGINYKGNAAPEEDFDFHITVYYTWNRLRAPEVHEEIEPFEVTPDRLKLLGENHDIPVLKVKVDGQLKSIREWFTQQGYKDKWPTYQPHVSLSYDKKHYNLSKLKLPDFPLTVVNLTVKNQ